MIHTIVQCLLFLFIIYCYRFWRNRRTWQLLGQLPGPPTVPLIGSMYILPGTDTSLYFRLLQELSTTHGSLYRIWLGPKPVVIVTSAEHARTILSSAATMAKASIYRFIPLHGIFSLPVQQWRLHRKLIQPSFKLSILQSFVPLFEQKANLMVRNLATKEGKPEAFDIYRFMARCTLDMICATSLGMDMHFQEMSSCSYLEILEELFELVTVRAVNVFLHADWLYRWTPVYTAETKALKEFRRPASEILTEKSSDEGHDNIEEPQRSSFKSLLEQLYRTMRKNGNADLEAIENEVNTMIFAGTETSASTVANTLLLLAMHPSIQEQVVAEIRQHFGDDVVDITYETLQELVYLEMVLKESLRLLPIALVVARKTTQELALGKHMLPADIDVIIDIYNIHRNPTYWGADVDQFRPERFSGNDYNRMAFLAFSTGSRNCIGMRYAWISMKIMLIKILAAYRLETDLQLKDLNMKIALTMKISNGHMVRLRRR
ncbi:cytochrome P450 4g15-like [Anopheles aquasalis]|uniref:cytochrome P450 4g15-like n=1 Tax=Anopheles aquasalis TaxID=42839 RepID=UPI00215A7CC5|nr:cytochrome P450 4g15-like [Anopheles aquasalis]